MSDKVLLGGSTPPLHIDPDVAMVGSSTEMLGLGYGEQIDQHAEVIRFNLAHIKGYEKDLGSRETIRYWTLTHERLGQLFNDKAKMASEIVLTTQAPTLISFLHMGEIQDNGEFHGRSENVHGLVPTERFLEDKGLKLDKPMRTGMTMIIALIESGIKPHVYGFSTGTKGSKYRSNYWNQEVVPTNGYHNIIGEEAILVKLAETDLITLHPYCAIKNRKSLATELIKDGDIVAELGVDWGSFSNFILGNTKCAKLHSIDRWAGDRGHDDKQEKDARGLLGKYGDRSEVVKATFEEAKSLYEDGTFDFIYIDGYAHTGQECGKTLSEWWSKVKPGGVFAGHDYSDK